MSSQSAKPERCPCLSGETYAQCCGRLIDDELPAPTAEALMRSRFTAFALHRAEYLLHSWHPRTRPRELALDTGLRWYRLDILGSTAGGPFDDEGTVEFRAYFRGPDRTADSLHENSRFVRVDGRWVYYDALAAARG